MSKCRRKRRLFWRIYAQSLVVLLAVGASMAFAGWLSNTGSGESWRAANQRLGDRLALDLQETGGGPEFAERVEQLHTLMEASISVYDAHGRRIAAAGPHTQGPLADDEQPVGADPEKSIRDGWIWTMAVSLDENGQTYAIIAHDSSGHAARGILTLFMVLLASGVVLYPLARSIARPLEKVAAAADDLGSGKLNTRVEIRRRDEIGELGHSFNRMAESIERLVTSEKELLANVSHELRTPLARIRVALELASESHDLNRVQRRLRSIEEDVAELDRLVEDVLVAARLDLARSGQMEVSDFVVRSGAFAAGELVETAAERFRVSHPEVTVEVEIGEDVWVDADPALLQRVLTNLLENAAKYGIADGEEGARVELVASADERAVRLEVRDHGAGIVPDEMERVFEPFFRSDRSRSDGSGVGLGLALSRRIIDAHNGRLWAEAASPGARFVVELPR